jgi:uncharacterized membrane-anchored protein YjiN (DUF445 family)
MCQACDDLHDDDNENEVNIEEVLKHLSEERKQEFYDYMVKQLGVVINAAESENVLFDLITQWPRDKQVAYEMATVIKDRVINDHDDYEE